MIARFPPSLLVKVASLRNRQETSTLDCTFDSSNYSISGMTNPDPIPHEYRHRNRHKQACDICARIRVLVGAY
jgi:hypothetical protein